MYITYEDFVRALESRREDISPLRWASVQDRDPRIGGWLRRWLDEQRDAPSNHEAGADPHGKGN
jgi:hypothetical protein